MKYEFSEQQVKILQGVIMELKTSYQERVVIDGLLQALSKPIEEKKEE